MQIGNGRALVGELQVEAGGDGLHRALHGEEVLLRAKRADSQCQALVGSGGQRQGLGAVDVGQLKQTALAVALLEVVDDDVQHAGHQRGAHDGQVLTDRVQDADGAALGRVLREVHHVEVAHSVERQRARLVEALTGQQALELELVLLIDRHAAVRDGRRLQEGGHDVVIAVLADDLLGQIGETVDVVAVAGNADLPDRGIGIDAEVQAGQDVADGVLRHFDAEHAVDLGGHDADDLARLIGVGRAVEAGGGDIAAAQLLNQMERALEAELGAVLVDALLVAGARVTALAEGAAGLADRIAGEGGALEQQLGGIALDLAVEAAHDAGQRDRLLGVADDQIVGIEGEFLLVQRGDLLALVGAADDDAAARDVGQVEGVHGLADLDQGVVRDVDDVVDRAQAGERQMAAHPAGAFARMDVADVVGEVARAEVGRFDADVDGRVGLGRAGEIGRGHLERLVQQRGDLAVDAQNALAVGAVRGDRDVEDIVIETDDLADVAAGDGVRIAVHDEQAVDLRARIPVVVQAELSARAHHTVGQHALHLARLDGDAAGQGGVVQRDRNERADEDVGCTGGDGQILTVFAAVDAAKVQMVGALLLLHVGDLTDDDPADLSREVDQLFYFKTAAEELFFQLLRGDVDVDKFFQPTEWYFHVCVLLTPGTA